MVWKEVFNSITQYFTYGSIWTMMLSNYYIKGYPFSILLSLYYYTGGDLTCSRAYKSMHLARSKLLLSYIISLFFHLCDCIRCAVYFTKANIYFVLQHSLTAVEFILNWVTFLLARSN